MSIFTISLWAEIEANDIDEAYKIAEMLSGLVGDNSDVSYVGVNEVEEVE